MSANATIDDHTKEPHGEVIAEITADGWVRIKKSGLKTHKFYVDVYRNGYDRRIAGVIAIPMAPDSMDGEIAVVDPCSFLRR